MDKQKEERERGATIAGTHDVVEVLDEGGGGVGGGAGGGKAEDDISDSEQERAISPIEMLSADILTIILLHLDEDAVGLISLTSSILVDSVPRCDVVFKQICQRIWKPPIYQLRLSMGILPSRFPTWRSYFLRSKKPVIRSNGLYVCRLSYIRPRAQRTMWDECPDDILQCIYYRYLRFRRDGRLEYLCTVDQPEKVMRMFAKAMPNICADGWYRVEQGGNIQAEVRVDDNGTTNKFMFELSSSGRGRGNRLLPVSHVLQTGGVESTLTIEPGTVWVFWRDWNL